MSQIGRRLGQLAGSVGRVLGGLVGLVVRLDALLRLFDDLLAYYLEVTAPPQDRKSVLLTLAIGAFVMLNLVNPFLFFVAWPLLLGYLVREMGLILYSDRDDTLLQAPVREDRPAFRDLFSMTVDGFKVGAIPAVLALTVGFVWYNTAGLADIGLNNIGESITVGGVLAAIVGLVGWVALPAFMARYVHTGSLGDAVSEPTQFGKEVVLSARYLPQFAIGTLVVGGAAAIIAGVSVLSPLLVVSLGPPILFVGLVQATDHFARAYQSAVDWTTDETTDVAIDPDTYLVPFREGEVSMPDRDRSILALGETGSGKTEAIKLLAYQFANDPQDPFVVFDYKSDYRRFFGSPLADGGAAHESIDGAGPSPQLDGDDPEDLVVLSLDGSSHIWNIFAEATEESDFEELGRTLFASQESAASDPFFPTAARQAFVGVLKVIHRDPEIESPTNADLVAYFEESDLEDIHNDLASHADLRGIAVNIDPETSRRMAGAVYGQIQTVVSEVFRGDFRKSGDFSIREYMADPHDQTLLLDFPADRGETIKPIFRLMIDWSIRFGLADPEQSAYYILDEFATIPGLERIERLVNVGRARNAYAILGVQAKSQLHSTYGRDEAESILSGLAQEVLLRPGDEASVEHIRTRLGRHQRVQLQQGPTHRFVRALTGRESEYNQYSILEEYPVSEAELQQFDPGEAVVIEPEGWRRGHLYTLDEVKDVLDQFRDEFETTT